MPLSINRPPKKLNWLDFARPVLAPVAAIGNALDLPASMVRDTMMGLSTGNWKRHNPFDQILTPLRDDNRASGADILTEWGMMRRNRETGLKPWAQGDWGEASRDVARLGFEILTDPLSWLTAAPLTKAGLEASKAGSLTKGIKAGIDEGHRSLVGLRLPLGNKPFAQGGVGPASQAVAGGLDRVISGIKESAPGRSFRKAFDAKVSGTSTREGQVAAEATWEARLGADQEVAKVVNDYARRMEKASLMDRETSDAIRSYIEGLGGKDIEGISTGLESLFQVAKSELRRMGVNTTDDLKDIIGFAPRQMTAGRKASAKGVFSSKDSADKGRSWVWKEWKGGTRQINEFLTDKDFKKIVQTANKQINSKAINKKEAEKAVSKYISRRMHDQVDAEAWKFIEPGGKSHWSFGKNDPKFVGEGDNWKMVKGVDAQGNPNLVDVERKVHDRHGEIARMALDNPEMIEEGLFNNHILVDSYGYLVRSHERAAVADVVYDTVSKLDFTDIRRVNSSDPRMVSLDKVFDSLGLDTHAAMQHVLHKQGRFEELALEAAEAGEKTLDLVGMAKRNYINEDIANDLQKLWPAFKAPEELAGWGKNIDSFTSMFKAGVLTFPARWVRDVVSGQVRNVEAGMFDLRSAKESLFVLEGKAPPGLSDLASNPDIAEQLQRMGVEASDESVAEALRQVYAAMRPHGGTQRTDLAGDTVVSGLEDILRNIPGRSSTPSALKQAAKSGTMDPRDIRGVHWGADEARNVSEFKPIKMGDVIGEKSDDMNRMVPFINLLRKGYRSDVAMDMINKAQVDYSARSFTELERGVLKRLFPFYSFTSRQVPWVAKSLLTNPGGRLGWMMRMSSRSQDDEHPAPEYVRKTLSAHLGDSPDGSKKFLTGLGLMHEDAVSFVGDGAGWELMSRANPLIKGPLEVMTEKSFFQGGRDLRDLDPAIGRTISNITGRQEPVKLPRKLEAAVMNSPLSRAITTTRTAFDPRKKWWEKGLNTLTGVRTTTVSPGVQEAVIREAISDKMRDSGAKAFHRVYFKKSDLEKMSPEEREFAGKLQSIMNELADRAKKRAKERK